MKTWRDYSATSVRDFLKHYTDGDVSHGGSRYECDVCGAEYPDHFGVRGCFYWNGHDGEFSVGRAIRIQFDENGEEIV